MLTLPLKNDFIRHQQIFTQEDQKWLTSALFAGTVFKLHPSVNSIRLLPMLPTGLDFRLASYVGLVFRFARGFFSVYSSSHPSRKFKWL